MHIYIYVCIYICIHMYTCIYICSYQDSPDFLSKERKVTISGASIVQINHAISLITAKVTVWKAMNVTNSDTAAKNVETARKAQETIEYNQKQQYLFSVAMGSKTKTENPKFQNQGNNVYSQGGQAQGHQGNNVYSQGGQAQGQNPVQVVSILARVMIMHYIPRSFMSF
jgi:hypothetical protein